MASKTRTLRIKRTVQAPPAEAFRAFTNSTALREWLCDSAQADPRKGGRLYLWWNSGYYSSGEYTAAESGKKVAFTWCGRGEPEATRVLISFKSKGGSTEVTLTHAGIGSGKKWAKTIREIEGGWPKALENLQSVLEVGHDLRYTLRPMLGISFDEFSPEIAARLGVPVKEGIRLSGTVEGMGARAAGLQKDDVMVSLGGRKVLDYSTLVRAVQGHRAGEKVPVVFYRGKEKKTVTMELSRRPLPEVPATAAGLAEAVRKVYAEMDAEIAKCFEGVTETEASHHPAPGEWSAKEAVAHLIAGERDNHRDLAELIGGHEAWYDGFGGNVFARLAGTVATFNTIPALLEELKRNEAETVAALGALPPEFVARKGSYWRLGHNLLQTAIHTRDHLSQIRAAVQSARQK